MGNILNVFLRNIRIQESTKLLILVDIFCSMQYGNIPRSIKEVHRQGSRQFLPQIRGDVDIRQWAVYGTASITRRGKMTSLTFFHITVQKNKNEDIACVANNSPKPVFIPLKCDYSSFSSHIALFLSLSIIHVLQHQLLTL